MTDTSPMVQAQQQFADRIPFASISHEIIPIDLALGRVLSHDIVAPADSPPYSRAIVEGYLVRTEDTKDATDAQPKAFRIIGNAMPGDRNCPTPKAGEAVQVATGSLVPEGPYSIVRQWEAKVSGDTFTTNRGFPPRFFIEDRGCDIKQGTSILKKGTRISPWEIGVCASLGIGRIDAMRKPRVMIFGSGDEVIPYTSGFIPGAIFDCNTPMLAAAISAAGGEPVVGGIQSDDFDAFVSAVKKALEYVDMVVISGGTAVGGRDFISDLLRATGELIIDGVQMKSGRPLIMGISGNKPLVCVAGHPPEALRGFRLFGELAINRLLGLDTPIPADPAPKA